MEHLPLIEAGNTILTLLMTSSLSFCRDNLGAHSIGGFVESFSATHCCRFCLGERSQFQILQCLIKPLLGSFFRTMTFTNLTYPMASLRLQEVVNQEPPVSDLKKRWPALFDATQINQEFRRITTVSLETTFLAKLDQYSPKIMYLLSSRGGTAKMKIQNMLVQDNSVETRREAAIRGLMVYLKEKEEQLFKEEDGDGDSTDQLMKIVTARGGSDPAHAKIVIEGTEVLTDVDLFPEPVPCSWG
ncbi:uncharacterized protein LOC118566352 isoform X3 [Fundulus heteroclitus]|uniref:uncharacterized protein LOC118566352 isoform X3 n=1 Tax=Fundulus heteroclitus TaxID=8078 RepID=UPI00165B8D46|nr:uncharacterized protein LOC118566352 isoform X3 [Fundulus heteroclitus]